MAKRAKLDLKISLVELPPTLYGEYNGDTGYDIYCWLPNASRALPTLEGILKSKEFHNVESYNPLFDGKHGKFTDIQELSILSSDVLGISTITRTSPQSIYLMNMYKRANRNGIGIVGGADASMRPEDYLLRGNADIVVRKEAELTLIELMERILEGNKDYSGIDGVSYKNSKGEVVHNPDRDFLSSEQLSSMPIPHYNVSTREKTITFPLETSRGCPHNCTFCGVTALNGRTYRLKSKEHVISGLESLNSFSNARHLFITDDNFAANHKRTIELLDRISYSNIAHPPIGAQVTSDVAEDQELLDAFHRANLNTVFIGIESINDSARESMKKRHTAERVKNQIKILKEQGLYIHGMLMAHPDEDTRDSLKYMCHWAKDNLDSMQLFAMTPTPGTPFWNKTESEGRFLSKDFSLYDGLNVVCRPNPKNFTPYSFQKAIHDFYLDYYSLPNMTRRFFKSNNKPFALALTGAIHLFGLREGLLWNPQSKNHLEYLKSIS
jgi:radical SAM superfamily enzyme YgiQ (UPF0313 family)